MSDYVNFALLVKRREVKTAQNESKHSTIKKDAQRFFETIFKHSALMAVAVKLQLINLRVIVQILPSTGGQRFFNFISIKFRLIRSPKSSNVDDKQDIRPCFLKFIDLVNPCPALYSSYTDLPIFTIQTSLFADIVISRTQSILAFWSAGQRQGRLWGHQNLDRRNSEVPVVLCMPQFLNGSIIFQNGNRRCEVILSEMLEEKGRNINSSW